MDPAAAPPTVQFAAAARALATAARALDLRAPSFRSPPRVAGATRTLRRRGGGAVVSVLVHERPWAAVLADLVEGVVVANGLTGRAAEQARTALWDAVAPGGAAAA